MLMFFALVILNVFHPGRLLVGPGSEFPKLSRAEKKQAKRETKERKAARKAERKLNGEYQQGGASDDTIYLGAIDPVRYQQVGNFSSRFSEDVATTYEPLQRV